MLSPIEALLLFAVLGLFIWCGFEYGREYERKRRYHPPIGTPGALQEQLHAIKAGGR